LQTTLLGLAIAIIIALVAALVGPSFIDWNQYKPQFEAEASRVVGAPVRVEGALDARLLPAPILRLHSLSIGAPGDATRMKADKLDVEFSLSSLMRGEWRANHLSLDGVALDLGLDPKGSVIAPSKGAFNFGALAIDKLDLTGRINVHDAASGADYAINDVIFSGDVRALGSNMRGEGSFAASGTKQPFRLTMSQAQDNRGVRLRVDVDPASDGALSGSLDGVLTFDQRLPKLDGTLTLGRQGDRPWRVSTKTKASPVGASFEQAEIVYGTEDAGLKLNGSGALSFGKLPQLRASISAQQLDADRALGKGESGNRSVIASARTLLAALPSLPFASQVNLNVDQVALGGKQIQNVAAALRGSSAAWTVDKFELTAPGSSRVSANGIVKPVGEAAAFTGPVTLQTAAARTFTDWLQGVASTLYRGEMPLRLAANITLAPDRNALDAIKGDLNGSAFSGSAAFSGARLQLALDAPSLNFDDAQSLLDISSFSLPKDADIKLDIAQAKIGGRDIRPLTVDLSYKAEGQPSLSKATADVIVRRADLAFLLGTAAPLSDFKSKLTMADDKISVTDFAGRLGGANVRGQRLDLVRGDTTSLNGDIAIDTINFGSLIGLALGASGRDATEPLAQGLFGSRGALAVKADTVTLPGGAALKVAEGTIKSDGSSLVLENFKASLGGGSVNASAQARRDLSGTSVNADLKITDADLAKLNYRGFTMPQARASLQMTLASEGRSASALNNALTGDGALTLKDARLTGLDPGAFDAAVQASEAKRDVKDAAITALNNTALQVASLQIPFLIKDARLRVDPLTFESGSARVTMSGGYDLPADQIDIRTSLRSAAFGTPAPEIQMFTHGTPDALQRDVDVSLLSSWLSLRAIERETKRLDDLEKGNGPAPAATTPAPQAPANQAAVPPQTPLPQPLPPSDVRVPGTDPRKPKPKPIVRPPVVQQPSVTASGQQLAPLPPPIDIRPAPGSRPRRPLAPLPPPGTTF
jgi:hypothetical protein